MDFLLTLNPVLVALLGTLFTYTMTALGAALVFFFKTIDKRILNAMLGFAAGIMIAASFFSLIAPAIDLAETIGQIPWLIIAAGFLSGGVFLLLIDNLIPHLHMGLEVELAEGIKTDLKRPILLVLAITLHNIPEGFAVGVAFGALANSPTAGTLIAAMVLALGIGIQNFPEGAAVSIPLRKEGISRFKSFLYGQASGIVEPIAGVVGALLVSVITFILPFSLSFAAGAMIYVVVEELIPEAQREDEKGAADTDITTIGAMAGFTIMMILDVALG